MRANKGKARENAKYINTMTHTSGLNWKMGAYTIVENLVCEDDWFGNEPHGQCPIEDEKRATPESKVLLTESATGELCMKGQSIRTLRRNQFSLR